MQRKKLCYKSSFCNIWISPERYVLHSSSCDEENTWVEQEFWIHVSNKTLTLNKKKKTVQDYICFYCCFIWMTSLTISMLLSLSDYLIKKSSYRYRWLFFIQYTFLNYHLLPTGFRSSADLVNKGTPPAVVRHTR